MRRLLSMKTLYTFFCLLSALLLQLFEKSPYPVKVVMFPIIIWPVLFLAVYADYKGWKSDTVL